MQHTQDPVSVLRAELEAIVSGIEASSANIARELRLGPPSNSAQITREQWEITRLQNVFFAFFQKLSQARRDESARIGAQGGSAGFLSMEWQQLNTRVGHVRVWLNEWPRVQSMLRGQFPERRRKLYPKPPAETDIGRAQSEAADLVFSELHKLLNPVPQDKDAQELGCYEDIGYPMTAFLAHIHAAYRIRLATRRRGPVSFLDVGCGVGMKLIAARRFFARVAGVEFDPGFVRRARRMVRATGDGAIRIHKADGRLFKKYADYDVVYFFRPMRDVDDLISLEEAIVAAVRPGTLLVAPYLGFGHRSERHNCPRIDGSVYLAKASKREAASLRRRAELTGTHIDRRETRFPGLWEPILQAAAENGFGLSVTNQLLES